MVKTTIIARVSDGLPLVASMDDEEAEDLTEYKNLAKQLFRRLATNAEESRCTVEAGQFVFHYLIEQNVCYLTLCEKTYPKKLAFSYLEELEKEFRAKHGQEVNTAARPYALIKFDTTIQKTKRQYKDSRTQRNMERLNKDLQDVTSIMTRNIQDVLGREDLLNNMQTRTNQLLTDAKKYRKDANQLNLQLLYRKYGPPTIVVFVVLFVLYLRFYWF